MHSTYVQNVLIHIVHTLVDDKSDNSIVSTVAGSCTPSPIVIIVHLGN